MSDEADLPAPITRICLIFGCVVKISHEDSKMLYL